MWTGGEGPSRSHPISPAMPLSLIISLSPMAATTSQLVRFAANIRHAVNKFSSSEFSELSNVGLNSDGWIRRYSWTFLSR